jgi:hypothetical protein
MAVKDFSKFSIYRWRYITGYVLVGLLLAGLLVFAGFFVPGGLTADERQAVVISESLDITNPNSLAVAHLPYYLMQALSLEVFGVSEFTIKLPSLILGLLSAVGIILLLRRWFRPNIAVMASLIAIATGQFLFIAQYGTPQILYVFWPIALLLLGTQITRGKRFRLLWKILFAGAVAASLYSPLSIYMILAIILTVSLHPHLRNAVRRLSKVKVALGIGVATLISAPLIWMFITNPGLGLQLLGIPTIWPDWVANVRLLAEQYLLFWAPSTGAVMTPVFGLGSFLLILLGIYRMIQTRETTRSYLVICWLIALLPIIIINPEFISILFVPAVLLLAAGLTSLIYYWYRLFPRNPYARIAGLLPLIVLVAALIGSGLDRYIYGYYYSPTVATTFSKDLDLLPSDTSQLVVSEGEAPFYSAVARYENTYTVSTEPTEATFTATQAARKAGFDTDADITRIVTNAYSQNSARFFVYQTPTE